MCTVTLLPTAVNSLALKALEAERKCHKFIVNCVNIQMYHSRKGVALNCGRRPAYFGAKSVEMTTLRHCVQRNPPDRH